MVSFIGGIIATEKDRREAGATIGSLVESFGRDGVGRSISVVGRGLVLGRGLELG